MKAIQRIRPGLKPEGVTALEWEKSKCDKSPTGSHWFLPENSSELRCCFCRKSHTEVWGTGQRSKKGVKETGQRPKKGAKETGQRPEKGAKETGKVGKHSKRGRPRKS